MGVFLSTMDSLYLFGFGTMAFGGGGHEIDEARFDRALHRHRCIMRDRASRQRKMARAFDFTTVREGPKKHGILRAANRSCLSHNFVSTFADVLSLSPGIFGVRTPK